MKISASAILALITILPVTNAWIFTTDSGQWDGLKSRGCTKAVNKKGTKFDWTAISCTIRIYGHYKDGSCTNQIGIADKDWKNHKLTKNMEGFRVSC